MKSSANEIRRAGLPMKPPQIIQSIEITCIWTAWCGGLLKPVRRWNWLRPILASSLALVFAKLGAGLALMALVSSTAQADPVGYGGKASISTETSDLLAEHSHDWSNATQAARLKMIITTKDPFTAENNYSYLQLREKSSNNILFRRPTSALSYIWISPDSNYIVGLSKIKLYNPYQIVVYSKLGERLFRQDLVGMSLTGLSESVTNWIFWYKEPAPKIEIVENGTMATLLVEDPLGGFNRFDFSTTN